MTDMHTAALMADHFDKIQKLPNPIEGVPNFRCVPGYQVKSEYYRNLFLHEECLTMWAVSEWSSRARYCPLRTNEAYCLQVYCCGQPTKQGFQNILETVTKSYPKEAPIIWINMRQEPSVYVNGSPMCARPPNKECIAKYSPHSVLNIPALLQDCREFFSLLTLIL